MAKRGERRPWRVRFVWDDSEIKGTETRGDEEHARLLARQLHRNSRANGRPITVTIQNRDTGVEYVFEPDAETFDLGELD